MSLRTTPKLLLGLALMVAMAQRHGLVHAQPDVSGAEVPASELQAGIETPPEKPATTGFPLLWKGLIQGGFISRSDTQAGEPAREFRLRETQLSVEGSPSAGISFFIEANFAEPGEEVRLNDAILTLDLSDSIRLVAGQLRVPLNRPAVSARTSLFVTEPRAAGPVQRKARDRGVNLVLTAVDGRVLYEQALVNGNGIQTNTPGNDDSDLLLEGRLVWFATGEWPLPLPAQTDLKQSPWSTFLKAGWASGKFEKAVSLTLTEQVRENTWNVGQAVTGKGFYAYWQYSQALATGQQDFDADSVSATAGYALPLGRYLALPESAARAVRQAWLEPKIQYESVHFDDNSLLNRRDQEIYRFGLNYYPFGTPELRLMVDHEKVVDPQHRRTTLVFLHYMF